MRTKISTLSPGLAKDYNATSTYDVGEYVLHQNAYWKCITAISEPESWTPAHWELDEEPLEHVYNNVDKTLKVSGAAADAKAVGDALRSGFTEWEFSDGEAHTITGPILGSDDSWHLILDDEHYSTNAFASESDAANALSLSFDSTLVTATRHLITPKKTSQLTNDSGFLTQHQDISGKLDGAAAYPMWTEGVYSKGTVRSYNGRLYKAASEVMNQHVTPDEAPWWEEKTIAELKQDALEFDNSPTQNSNNPVKSGGVYTALQAKASLTDLPYRLVEPGEWEISPPTYQGQTLGLDWRNGTWVALIDGDEFGVFLDGDENALELSFSLDVIYTATRASLPGHLLDRAVNKIQSSAVTFPAAVEGKSRDFLIYVPQGFDQNFVVNQTDESGASVELIGNDEIKSGTVARVTEIGQVVQNGVVSSATFNIAVLDYIPGKNDMMYEIVSASMSDDWKFYDLPEGHTATTRYQEYQEDSVIWYLYLDGSDTSITSTPTLGDPYTEDSTYLEYGSITYEGENYSITAARIFDLSCLASNQVTASTKVAIRFPAKVQGRSRDFIVKASVSGNGSIDLYDKDAGGDPVTLLNQPALTDGAIVRFTEITQGVFEISAPAPSKTSDIVNDGQPAGASAPTGNQYAIVSQIPTAYTSTPKEDGSDGHSNGNAGTSGSWAKGDHIHPHDSTKLSVSDVYETWDGSKSYAERSIVLYNNRLYRATAFVTVGEQNPASNDKWTDSGIPKIQKSIDGKYTFPNGGIPSADFDERTRDYIAGKFEKSHLKRITENVTDDDVIIATDVKEGLESKADIESVIFKRDIGELGVLGEPEAGESWFLVERYNSKREKVDSHKLEWNAGSGAWVASWAEELDNSSSSSSGSSSSSDSPQYRTVYMTLAKSLSYSGKYDFLMTGIGTIKSAFSLDPSHVTRIDHSSGTYYLYSMSDRLAKMSDLASIEVSSDKISDSIGNVINADRTVVKAVQTPPHYTITFGSPTESVDLEGGESFSTATFYYNLEKYYVHVYRLIDSVGDYYYTFQIYIEQSSGSSSESGDSSGGSSSESGDSSGSDGQFVQVEFIEFTIPSSGYIELYTEHLGIVTLTWSNGTSILETDELVLKSEVKIDVDQSLSNTSENPVQNKVVTAALAQKASLSDVPTSTSQLTNDSGFITTAEVPTPSFIQDENGNKIEADRTIEENSDAPWTIIISGLAPIVLEKVDDNHWQLINQGSNKYYVYYDTPSGDWWYEQYYWDGSDWAFDTDYPAVNEDSIGNKYATYLQFGYNTFATATRQLFKSGKLALEEDLPTKTSQLTNDSGFITSTQVEPYQYIDGYAVKATTAWATATRNSLNNGQEFPVMISTTDQGTTPRGTIERYYLPDWSLTQYDQTTYATTIKLTWQLLQLKKKVATIDINVYYGYGWISDPDDDGRQYAIGCDSTYGEANPDYLYYNDGTGKLFNVKKSITLSEDGKSITALQGDTAINCSRTGGTWSTTTTPMANLSDLPTATSQLTNDSGFVTSSDLPYRLFEPGEWEFSGANYNPNVTYTVIVTIDGGGAVFSYNLYGDGTWLDEYSSATNTLDVVNFSTAGVIATHAYRLLDHAVNAVSVTDTTTITLPSLVTGKSRDFYLRMTMTGSQNVSFSPSTGITYTGLGNPSKTYSAGTYLLRFTETAENEFCVASPLSASQVFAIDYAVDGAQTVATYSGGTTLRLDISGGLIGSSVPNRESLVGIRFGSAVTGIGNLSFSGCTSLTSVKIPGSVVSISDEAFSDCSGLMSVEIPDSVGSIGDFAFSGCENLASVSVTPRSEASIGEGAFAYCTGLTYVTVGSGVLNIGPNAFAGCSSLERVTFRGRSLDEVKGMSDYPWGIDTSVIKADVALSDLPYALVSKTPANGSAALSDRAVNAVPVSSPTTLTLPEKIDGKSRDLYVRLTVSADGSAVTFSSTDSGGDAVTWDTMGDPSGTFAEGTYLYRITESDEGLMHAEDMMALEGVEDALEQINDGTATPSALDMKLDATSAAPAFDPTLTYIVGEYVTYGGILYRCKISVTVAGAWTGDSNWVDVDMTSPDATLDLRSDGRLAVVAADSEILWIQGYDMASASDVVLSCEKVNFYAFASGTTTQTFNMPSAPGGKVGDFVLDIDNSANASTAATATLNGFGTSFDVIVPKGQNLFTDILTFDGGEMCELYFTMTAFGTAAKPAWKVVKQVVEKQEAGS